MSNLGRKGPLRAALEDGTLEDFQNVLRSRSQVSGNKADPCWIWTGYCNGGVYGQIRGRGTQKEYVHRALWWKAHSDIPVGMHVHHICTNTRCVRLSHLELVTSSENIMEKQLRTAMETRIFNLETELRRFDPNNPVLAEGLNYISHAPACARGKAVQARSARRSKAQEAAAAGREQRWLQLDKVNDLCSTGMTINEACLQVGMKRSAYTYWQDQRRYAASPPA